MKELVEIYRASCHETFYSYDTVIKKHVDNNTKFKMTYEASNAVEIFSGYQLVNGKWEKLFDLQDLEEIPDRSMYTKSTKERLQKANNLFNRGMFLFLVINS
jgi:hypothetical protein